MPPGSHVHLFTKQALVPGEKLHLLGANLHTGYHEKRLDSRLDLIGCKFSVAVTWVLCLSVAKRIG